MNRTFLAVLAAVLGGLLLASPSAQARDLNCSDFSNQAQAQKHLTPGDPHGLDGDGNGVACESLPCPCSKARPGKGSDAPDPPRVIRFRATVSSVVDGDTIEVRRRSGSEESIRILGIDTPEVYGGVECGGPAASKLMGRLARGRVVVKTDPNQPKRDRYGRLLAYVSKSGVDLGRRMVSKGRAKVYVVGERFSRYGSYIDAQRRAKRAERGTWRSCGRI